MQHEAALTLSEIDSYHNDGFVLTKYKLNNDLLSNVKEEVTRLAQLRSDANSYEPDRQTVRSIHGCHISSELIHNLATSKEILSSVTDIVNSEVYIYQSKINVKRAKLGQAWAWHQDYAHWKAVDHLPTNDLVNVAIFLDDVDDVNGPLIVAVGSHKNGVIDTTEIELTGWDEEHSADIRYAVSSDALAEIKETYVTQPLTGKAGTLLFFDGLLVHGSSQNMSNLDRNLMILSYCSIENTPKRVSPARPEYLVARDYSPLTAT